MDRSCQEILQRLNLPNLHTIALEELEAEYKELLKAKSTRSRIEYYFTCTPSLPLYILNNRPEVDIITYLDADLFFFADPAPVFHEFVGHSIAITPHRFPPELRSNERRGIYNVGYLSFRRNQNALACLQWWQNKCIQWCYDRVENNRYADQKYLDDWPTRFQDVLEIKHKGANLAPWNLYNCIIKKDKNTVCVDDQPLIFFHFHGFRQITPWLYDTNWARYKVKPSPILKHNLAAPYIQELVKAARMVSSTFLTPSLSCGIRNRSGSRPLRDRIWTAFDNLACTVITIFTGNYIVIINGHIL